MKLTPEQKVMNKAATSLRDKAYNKRYNEYRLALAKGEEAFTKDATTLYFRLAERDFDLRFMANQDTEAALRKRISALEAELKVLQEENAKALEPLREGRGAAWKAWRNAQEASRKKIEDQYPDMVGVAGAAQWKPFTGFLPEVAGG